MGVDYDNNNIFNPLAQLPGNLGSGFIISANDVTNPNLTPELIVGLTPSNMQGFVFAPLGPSQGSGLQPDGLKVWDTKAINTCFSVNSGSPNCLKSVFDTGAGSGTFWTTTTTDSHKQVPAGDEVTIEVPHAVSLSLVAGDQSNSNLFYYE